MSKGRRQTGKRDELTPRQAAFVRAYLKTGVGKTAAIAAGYAESNAESQASTLLRDPKVSKALGNKAASLAEQAGISAVEVLRELRRIALLDMGKAYGPNGKLLPINDIPEDTRRALVGVETEELWAPEGDDGQRIPVGDVRKVKFADKNKALEALGKHFKLFTEVHEHRHSLADLVNESMDDGGEE